MKRVAWGSLVAAALLGLQAPAGRASAAHVAAGGVWTRAADMLAPAMSHQAVLLHDGRVLVLGGEPTLGVPVAWVQVYNPLNRAWSTTGSMNAARIGFSATVLRDGRVLAVGGIGATMNDLASAEVWTPATGQWATLPNLPRPRFSQAGALLRDGRVLLVGGIVGGTISRTTLIFDPGVDTFVAGPPTHHLHAQANAVVMGDGTVLIAGGYGGSPEIYHPGSRSWTVTGPTPQRIRPLMTTLPDGSVLLAGGTSAAGRDLRTASVFLPAANRWLNTGPLNVPRNSEFGALLPDGLVLAAGGEQVDEHLLRTAELYDPRKRAWSITAPMHAARSGATSILLRGGTVLVCGGGAYIGALSSCELYHRK